MNLPNSKDKKLVSVTFTFEDGEIYTLDEKNALNFQRNMDATSIMGIRGHIFAPVDWEKHNAKRPVNNDNGSTI